MGRKARIVEEALIQLYNQGKSDSEIAEHFKVSKAAVCKKRKSLGLIAGAGFPFKGVKERPVFRVDSTWRLIEKEHLARSFQFVRLYERGGVFRLVRVNGRESVWCECHSLSEARSLFKWLRSQPWSRDAAFLRGELERMGYAL